MAGHNREPNAVETTDRPSEKKTRTIQEVTTKKRGFQEHWGFGKTKLWAMQTWPEKKDV